MSQITVGYTDKVRKIQPRGPAGGISDIFGFSEGVTRYNQENGKPQKELDVTNKNNDNVDTKICERTETLTIEENSNEIKKTVESTTVEVEQTQVTTTKVESSNGNMENDPKPTPKKAVNNIIHSDEKDSAAPQKRNRVPPGGYSSGLW